MPQTLSASHEAWSNRFFWSKRFFSCEKVTGKIGACHIKEVTFLKVVKNPAAGLLNLLSKDLGHFDFDSISYKNESLSGCIMYFFHNFFHLFIRIPIKPVNIVITQQGCKLW